MGVHGLWDLIAPVGRRVSVETLAGKKLAIDASIWLVQFMKAMRDEKGEMVRNAHLLGFFRRICKLLYLKTKPVFVFDGGTPALKRRTVIARRRQRENAQAKIRKTAEKLLLNQLKTMRLKELAKDLENQRKNQKKNLKGKKILSGQTGDVEDISERPSAVSASDDKENLDELFAASITAEENARLSKKASTSAATILSVEDGKEMILPTIEGNVDQADFAALPPSMQHDLLQKQKTDAKGKKILSDYPDRADKSEERKHAQSKSYDHVKFDEMLAASIAAEENGSLSNNASKSADSVPIENDSDGDEEMIFPVMHGDVDPAVLAALPPSMQLDLLVQMRERLMAENRQKYQKVKKAPEKFSELQIQAYLKTVAFRREIDDVQKAASGRGVGGVQTSRIASESNREFIFSSSFSGDKQVLTSARADGNEDKQHTKPSKPPLDSSTEVPSISKSNAVKGSESEESRSAFDGDVETYLDERGCMRVSRLRAMGIRMTRDLQRNLDMMKEIEHENTDAEHMLNLTGALNTFSVNNKPVETSHDIDVESVNFSEKFAQSMPKNYNAVEISFDDTGGDKCVDDVDDVFARLVANDPVIFSNVSPLSKKQSSDSISDSDWEEGIVEGKGNACPSNVDLDVKPQHYSKEGTLGDESEVEWEEGLHDASKASSSYPDKSEKLVSRGYLEEEANFQEAIRRSLLDASGQVSNPPSLKHEIGKNCGENAYDVIGLVDKENNNCGQGLVRGNVTEKNELLYEVVDEAGRPDAVGVSDSQQVLYSLNNEMKLSVSPSPTDRGELINKAFKIFLSSNFEQSCQDQSQRSCSLEDVPRAEPTSYLEPKDAQYINGQCMKTTTESDELPNLNRKSSEDRKIDSKSGFSFSFYHKISDTEAEPSSEVNVKKNDFVSDGLSNVDKKCSEDEDNNSESEFSNMIHQQKNSTEGEPSNVVDGRNTDIEDELMRPSHGISKPSTSAVESSGNKASSDVNVELNMVEERTNDRRFSWMEQSKEKSGVIESVQSEFTEASLEEEMRILDQESIDLGDEQRKLERNAESVSSEMFAECQELLQMFGLPYIIAPMEAEAQCAYLELANLVDGVVTDDSDVFLFGARSVYKNIFDDRKYVETYFMQDIEKELGLTREKLIRMALLLGSDYTEGISGIGIVNAIEVVNAFSEEDGLRKFREWIESPDPSILGIFDVQTGSNEKKKGSKANLKGMKKSAEGSKEIDQDTLQAGDDLQSADHSLDVKRIFMENHRNVSKNWHIPSTFPSEAVISAYTCPQVDKSTEPFSWGKPDIFVLRKMCWDRFGWGKDKSDELLLPVLKEYEKRETQLRLEAFYTFNERFAKIRSKRIKKAVKGITGKQSAELMDAAEQEASRSKKKRRINCTESVNNETEIASKELDETIAFMQNRNSEKLTSKQSRKRKILEKPVSSQLENPVPSLPADAVQRTDKVSRGKGKDKVQRVGKARGRREKLDAEVSETSSSDGCGADLGEEFYGDKFERPQEVRRSTRSRRTVNYSVNDSDTDDARTVPSNKECSDKDRMEQDLSGIHEVHGDISAGLDRNQQHEAGDALVSEGLRKDYLELGGGSCTEKVETDQPGARQNDDPSLEAITNNDYLNMGGGFCLGERETGENQPAPQNLAVIGGNAKTSPCFASEDKFDHDVGLVGSVGGRTRALDGTQNQERSETPDTGPNPIGQNATDNSDHSKLDDRCLDSAEIDTGKAFAGALSAMPFLRRKRRKNR